MRPVVRALAKWSVLTALAIVVGGGLGSAYALTMNEPVMESAAPAGPAADDLELTVMPAGRDETAPPAPVLVTPQDGALVSLRPLLTWEAVHDGSNVIYGLQLSTDPGFPPETTTTVRNLETPEWRPTTPFTPLVKIHWRVYALDAGLNEGPASEARAFTPVFPLGDVQVGVTPPR